MGYPQRRMRRLRATPALRRLVAEAAVSVDDLVAPLFLRAGISSPAPVGSMPGVVQHSRESLRKEARRLVEVGVPAVILFGVPDPASRDAEGSAAWSPDGITQVGLRDLRDEVGDDLVVMADLCLDEFTSHGHCGVLAADGSVDNGSVDNGLVDNDATLDLYGRVAVAQAGAGAAVVAPSGMMDGQVGAIRAALDGAGHTGTAILAYSAKFASPLYGPFRDAVEVEIAGGGDRRTYQQDPANRREAVAEATLDMAEGADMVMVKPALPYLDVIAGVRAAVDVPVAAYQVSGEYSMIAAAAERGWVDRRAAALESLISIKRAGADVIVTYFAAEAAEWL